MILFFSQGEGVALTEGAIFLLSGQGGHWQKSVELGILCARGAIGMGVGW